MRFLFIIFTVVLLMLSLSCTEFEGIVYPDFNSSEYLKDATYINDSLFKNIDGLYKIESERVPFGTQAVIKTYQNHISIFCEANTFYVILKSGKIDNKVRNYGYYRKAVDLISNEIYGEFDLIDLLNNSLDSNKTFSFSLDVTTNNSDKASVKFTKIKSINFSSDFKIIAHRGGGRNSDYLPYSENSIELMKFSPLLGANSIEIDVQSSKDRIPFIYHDSFFSTRLIDGEFLIGPTENFSLKQIKTFGKFKKGENIPTLEEALDAVVKETELEMVWVDCKSKLIVNETADLVKKYQKIADEMNRKIQICIGIPTEEVYEIFKKRADFNEIKSICELSFDKVLEIDSKAFGPSWTVGLLKKESEELRKIGKYLYAWTLDEDSFIEKYLKSELYDGFVTNYPSLVFYQYHTFGLK